MKHAPLPLEGLEEELPGPTAPAEEFDLVWARTVLAETLQRMETDCRNPAAEQPRRSFIWEMFRIRLLEPTLNDAPQVPSEDLITRFQLRSPMDASNLLLSGKRIFKAHLNQVIREYAGQDAATQAEIEALQTFLNRLGRRD